MLDVRVSLFLIATLPALSGCASSAPQPQETAARAAFFENNPWGGVEIETFDGKPLQKKGVLPRWRIEPGQHTVVVRVTTSAADVDPAGKVRSLSVTFATPAITFDAKPGFLYVLSDLGEGPLVTESHKVGRVKREVTRVFKPSPEQEKR